MYIEYLILYIFLLQVGQIKCPDRSDDKEADHIKKRKLFSNDYPFEPNEQRLEYERVHAMKYKQNLENYRFWPALDNKSPIELATIGQKFAQCMGIGGVIASTHTIEKDLMYPFINIKSRPVVMLVCVIDNSEYNFIDGAEKYIAFLSLPKISHNKNIFIVAACPKSLLPDTEADFRLTPISTTKDKSVYEEPLDKLCQYEKLHYNKYKNNFQKHRFWAAVEGKSPVELSHIAKMFASCIKVEEILEYSHFKLEQRNLNYWIKGYKPRHVKMLSCHQQGKRSYYFIEGAGNYSSFFAIRKGNFRRQKIFIAAACPKGTSSLGVVNEPQDDYDIKPLIPKVKSDYDNGNRQIESHPIQFF